MITFDLITDGPIGRPLAAVLPEELPMADFYFVNSLLPEAVLNWPDLAKRWGVHQVLAEPSWMREQLKRKPMIRPKGHTLQILS